MDGGGTTTQVCSSSATGLEVEGHDAASGSRGKRGPLARISVICPRFASKVWKQKRLHRACESTAGCTARGVSAGSRGRGCCGSCSDSRALRLVAAGHGACVITAVPERAAGPKRTDQGRTRVGLLRLQPPAPQGHAYGRGALVWRN